MYIQIHLYVYMQMYIHIYTYICFCGCLGVYVMPRVVGASGAAGLFLKPRRPKAGPESPRQPGSGVAALGMGPYFRGLRTTNILVTYSGCGYSII